MNQPLNSIKKSLLPGRKRKSFDFFITLEFGLCEQDSETFPIKIQPTQFAESMKGMEVSPPAPNDDIQLKFK
jgi:hypothetical protein